MPSTYKDSTYELLFPKYKEKTSFAYNILRIFVNGTINREIRLDDFKGWLSGTKESSNATFNFQIHPISSDVEFYTIRTYTKALNYAEIQKNRISTILNLADKEAYVSKNDILREDGTISLYKAAKKYNVIAIVLPDGSNPDYPAEQPLWYGNRNTEVAVVHIKREGEQYQSIIRMQRIRMIIMNIILNILVGILILNIKLKVLLLKNICLLIMYRLLKVNGKHLKIQKM